MHSHLYVPRSLLAASLQVPLLQTRLLPAAQLSACTSPLLSEAACWALLAALQELPQLAWLLSQPEHLHIGHLLHPCTSGDSISGHHHT